MKRRERVTRNILQREPNCRPCAALGIEVPAVAVTPVVEIKQGGTWAKRNLQPVCHRHAGADNSKSPALARILRRKLRQRQIEQGIHDER